MVGLMRSQDAAVRRRAAVALARLAPAEELRRVVVEGRALGLLLGELEGGAPAAQVGRDVVCQAGRCVLQVISGLGRKGLGTSGLP